MIANTQLNPANADVVTLLIIRRQTNGLQHSVMLISVRRHASVMILATRSFTRDVTLSSWHILTKFTAGVPPN